MISFIWVYSVSFSGWQASGEIGEHISYGMPYLGTILGKTKCLSLIHLVARL